MTKISKYEIEEALAKLNFYIKMSLHYKPYMQYKDKLQKMLDIVEKWIIIYSNNNDLSKINDNDARDLRTLCEEIPFEAYNNIYFEYIETFVDMVTYYANCPVNQDFDEKSIVRKGEIK